MSSESGHWYTRDGKPAHTQPTKSKNAKSPERATTVADARKLLLLPSVSGVNRMLAAPGLERYKINCLLDACINRPIIGEESEAEYKQWITEKAEEEMRKSATFGTAIHAEIEKAITAGGVYFNENLITLPNGEQAEVEQIIRPAIRNLGLTDWHEYHCEKVLVHRNGYAGTADLIVKDGTGYTIWDYKTKKTTPGREIEQTISHKMQLSAYKRALSSVVQTEDINCINVYISSTEIGRVDIIKYTATEIHEAFSAFISCLNLWKIVNEYDPSF